MPLTLIEPKRQTLPEINVHARLFGTLEYLASIFLDLSQSKKLFEINPPLENYIKN